jgi:hypothetical protein
MSKLDAQLALMAVDTISDYPANWMYILPNNSISNFQCLGCLDVCPCGEDTYQPILDEHTVNCSSNSHLAISRFELLSVLEELANIEYQTKLNSAILSNILSRGGAWAIMAKELGWLLVEDNRYLWEADFSRVVAKLNVDEANLASNTPSGIIQWLERTNTKENNG